MEKDPNSQINNTEEHISPSNTLEDMPSYEEHMREMVTNHPTEKGYESSEKRETPQELRDRFVIAEEYYGERKSILEEPFPLSAVGAIRARYSKFEEDWKEVEWCSRRDLSEPENLSELRRRVHEAKEFLERTKEVEDRIENGDWNPGIIAEKYGPQVEKYGVSLADVNRVLRESWSVDDPSLASNGMVFIPIKNESQPYEYFCENISDVIDKHFSENTPEEQKEMMGSIIRKYVKHENDKDRYIKQLEEGTSTTEIKEPEEVDFSEGEIDFLAKMYADANKAAGNSLNRIYLDNLRGGSTTDDKLLDGIMYGLYGGPNFDSALSIHDSKIGKKMKEYME